MRPTKFRLSLVGLAMIALNQSLTAADQMPDTAWPQATALSRPWCRWWWMGSAVDEANIQRELKRYHDAGLGGVEVTPIYGVKGNEANEIPYLSDKWMDMLDAAISSAHQLGMRVDMTTGTGWCFGGPTVTPGDSCAEIVANAQLNDITQKPTGLMVKRAAPGGQGPMVNPFYPDAVRRYLDWFKGPFATKQPQLDAVFQDSYEYNSQWSPDFLVWFEKMRGYRLQEHLPELLGSATDDATARVKSDYRETISDLMTQESMPIWVQWAHDHHALARYQAHGAPANLLDLYGIADIPETEFFDKERDVLISKFASSAAHTGGKNLVGAEMGTWVSEHFTETLSELKTLADDMFLAGINHVIYHGTAYSPDDAAWPGWCFYASGEINPRNAIWRDIPTLNTYITRCQSMLQAGKSDSDVLVYWPIHDRWNDAQGLVQQFVIDGKGWFHGEPIEGTATRVWDAGYTFDYISDRQILGLKNGPDGIMCGSATYRAIVVPPCRLMPVETLQKLVDLAAAGATIIFDGKKPEDVPGLNNLELRRKEMQQLFARAQAAKVGDAVALLSAAGVEGEEFAHFPNLRFVRRRLPDSVIYFIANRGQEAVTQAIKLNAAAGPVELMDPMTGRAGLAASDAAQRVRLQLDPGQTLIVRVFNRAVPGLAVWNYNTPTGAPAPLNGTWSVKFVDGGPSLPTPAQTATLGSWTQLDDDSTRSFAGTALYSLTFDAPAASARTWSLDLGKVCESARVRLNGHDLGTLIAPPYFLRGIALQPRGNVLEVEVTSTSANRIRDLDLRQVKWKIFDSPNVLNIKYKPFDASHWPVRDCGLLGPVVLQPES